MTLRDEVRKVLSGYRAGYYTVGETQWRLLTLIDEPNQVEALLTYLPSDFAEDWLAWLRTIDDGRPTVYISGDGRSEMSEKEKKSYDAVLAWLRDHRKSSGGE
jgi:hypothetical protein